MNTINYHPDEEAIIHFSLGKLSEPESLILISHSAYCSICKNKIKKYEDLAGDFLENEDEKDVSDYLLSNTLNQLEDYVDKQDKHSSAVILKSNLSESSIQIPSAIGSYLKERIDLKKWSATINNVRYFDLNFSNSNYKGRIFEIPPGKAMPKHGHKGFETTLVLHGSYTDENGNYRKGDMVTCDDKNVHKPISSEKAGCLCLVISSGSLKFKGLFGSLLNLTNFS